ncbi:HD-GYP domain-containing protein [Chitinilyticum aquatile]|uniref:HD-GYP domain-containing protein n=1 Tax=Chitinilyticum aquatile TaxID=362520 RepID=UPI0004260F90|nr:HD domain-containing phosphohydrolase [Chitinilyticum aquatile]
MNDRATEVSHAGNVTNPFMLQQVIGLAESLPVAVTEDIYCSTGVKLVSKGSRVDASLRDRLLQHKLRKPLERCLDVADSSLPALSAVASDAARAIPAVQAMIGPGALSELDRVTALLQEQGARLQLVLLGRGCRQPLGMVALGAALAIELAQRLQLDEMLVETTAMAALLCDIGELYIDPALLAPGRALRPEEWRHVLVHPLVSARVVREMGIHSSLLVRAIEEHHERGTGAGYPRGLQSDAISLPARILSVSHLLLERAAGQHWPLSRIAVGLRFMRGEHESALVDLVISESRLTTESGGAPAREQLLPQMHALLLRIGEIVEQLHHSEEMPLDGHSRSVLGLVSQRFQQIQRAFSSTGLDLVENEQLLWGDVAPGVLESELAAILDEIGWRLDDLGHFLAIRAFDMPADQQAFLQPLIDLLTDRKG